MTRAAFIQISIALLALVIPEVWKDMFEWLRQSAYWRLVQALCLIWIIAVLVIGVPWAVVFEWGLRNRLKSAAMLALGGALLFGGGFYLVGFLHDRLVAKKAVSTSPVTAGLSASVVDYTYDTTKNELVASVAFNNMDDATRVVLGVRFMFRTPEMIEKGDEMKVFYGDESRSINSIGEPLYVQPKTPIIKQYRLKITDDAPLKADGNIFGLYISTLNKDGDQNYTTLGDIMRVLSPLQPDLPTGYATMRHKAESLDIPYYTKIKTPTPAPKVTPLPTAAPVTTPQPSPPSQSVPPKEPPAQPTNVATPRSSPELDGLRFKLNTLLEKRERIRDTPNSPGFDMDAARARNERFIAEVTAEIQRREGVRPIEEHEAPNPIALALLEFKALRDEGDVNLQALLAGSKDVPDLAYITNYKECAQKFAQRKVFNLAPNDWADFDREWTDDDYFKRMAELVDCGAILNGSVQQRVYGALWPHVERVKQLIDKIEKRTG